MRVSSPKAEPVLAEALARGLRRNGFAVAIALGGAPTDPVARQRIVPSMVTPRGPDAQRGHTAPRAGDDGMTASG
jgi:hypothetical protein